MVAAIPGITLLQFHQHNLNVVLAQILNSVRHAQAGKIQCVLAEIELDWPSSNGDLRDVSVRTVAADNAFGTGRRLSRLGRQSEEMKDSSRKSKLPANGKRGQTSNSR